MTNWLKSLGGVAEGAEGYDEIMVTPAHHNRLMGANAIAASPVRFGDVKVVPSPSVTEGMGILRSRGQVVGVIDFSNGGKVILMERSKQ